MFKRKSTEKKATVSLFQRVKTRLASWKQKAALPDSYPDFAKTVAPAMEQLTKQLIEETVGSRSEMMQSFRRQMAAYNTNTTPISPEHAKKIIFSMLDGAVNAGISASGSSPAATAAVAACKMRSLKTASALFTI